MNVHLSTTPGSIYLTQFRGINTLMPSGTFPIRGIGMDYGWRGFVALFWVAVSLIVVGMGSFFTAVIQIPATTRPFPFWIFHSLLWFVGGSVALLLVGLLGIYWKQRLPIFRIIA